LSGSAAWQAPAGTGGVAGRRPPVVVCRRSGRQWLVELAGRAAYVEHSLGMGHLATLLANPGQEIPAIELAAGSRPQVSCRETALTAQPVLDDLAKRRYKQRLSQLQAEIDHLESIDEFERADATRDERDWLIKELASATGLGGRTRNFTANEERARIPVGKAIRRALDRITEADPTIGAELRATVLTGMRCCYFPG
jgi:hypothetical protein